MSRPDHDSVLSRDDALFILAALEKSSAQEIQIDLGGLKLALRRGPAGGSAAPLAPLTVAAATAPAPSAEPAAAAATTSAASSEPAAAPAAPMPGAHVLSPAAGTAYRAPAPGADPFVEVGDRVEAGATVAIVEAMKLMMSVTAPTSGVVSQICFSNAQPVGFDDVLIVIEADDE